MSSVVIQNTGMFEDGLDVLETVSELFDNPHMLSIYPRSLVNVTNYWAIYGNAGADFQSDKLEWFNNASWRDLGRLFELPALTSVNQSLEVGNGINLTSVVFPKLSSIGDSLCIQNNPNLTYFGVPMLQSVPGASIYILNNSELASPGNFTKLESVGDITLIGNFTQ